MISQRKRVDKPGTALIETERWCRGDTQLGGQDTRDTRKHVIRDDTRLNNQIQILWGHVGLLQGLLRRRQGQVRCTHFGVDLAIHAGVIQRLQIDLLIRCTGQLLEHLIRVGDHAAFFDASALGDPLVTGIHGLSQEIISHHIVRYVHACGENFRFAHRLHPLYEIFMNPRGPTQ